MKPFHITRVGYMARAFVEPTGWINRLYLRARGYSFDTPWCDKRLVSKARVWRQPWDL